MKKIILAVTTILLTVVITSCKTKKNDIAEKTTTIISYNGAKEKIQLSVPLNPKRVAVLDLASLDIIDALGVGDHVVGTATTTIEYLKKYSDNPTIAKLGNIKTADMEAVMKCQPDIIFIGGRLATSYDALSEIAPVVFLETATDQGLYETIKSNAETIADIFGVKDTATTMMTSFTNRIDALQKIAAGKTAIIGMCTNGGFNVLGNNGRCSIIGNEIGFTNIGVSFTQDKPQKNYQKPPKEKSTGTQNAPTHGNEVSFEFLVQKDPDYLFVLDRDAAIGTNGAKLAKEILENEIVKTTHVYKANHILYLEHPAVWYTAEGGITAFDYMLKDLETLFSIQ